MDFKVVMRNINLKKKKKKRKKNNWIRYNLLKILHALHMCILRMYMSDDQGWISRKVLKHGLSLLLRYVLFSYQSLFYL